MSRGFDIPPRLDWLAKLLCVAIGAVFGLAAAVAYSGFWSSSILFWMLAAATSFFVCVAVFGPRSLRNGIVSVLPVW